MNIYNKFYLTRIKNLIHELQGVEYHDELNPNLWDGFKLKKEIREHLLKIAELFFDYLKVEWVDINDIVITGSSANYNYTKYSDIDLHLIIDYEKVHKNCPLVDEFFDAKKSLFNKKHDITIKNQPVELYVEDISSPATSSGVYSVIKNKWIKKPEHKPVDINDNAVKAKLNHFKTLIENILSGGKSSSGSEEAEDILSKIYKMRSSGLEKAGEFSVENLVFKILRNENYIDKLKNYITQSQDKEISI